MVAKKIMALLVSASLVVGACPLSRGAYATEAIAVEDDAIQLLDDADVEVTAQSSSSEDVAPEGIVDAPGPTVYLQSDAGLPSKFDLRDRGVVTPVKNQEPWGYCWAHGAIAATETSILSAMGSTYADTGLDLSERHLAWYAINPVTEAVSKSQVGEGLYAYDTSVNSVFDFGGREQCAGTLFAQGIGPMPESDYPCRGANGTLASDDFVANKDAYLQQRIAFYKSTYWWADDDTLRSMAESDYNRYVGLYQRFDAYSPFDDWSITEPDEAGSGRLRGSAYTLTDNNVFNYWARIDSDEELAEEEHFRKQPLYRSVSHALWQDSIDQIKSELYEGHGVSVGVTISDDSLNTDTWSAYDSQFSAGASHVVCIVGWDDGYAASNFTHTTDREGATLWGDEEKAAQLTTPPGNGAWICKNSWGSETDAVAGGLMASDGTTKDAHAGDWGIVDENGKHTGYYYLSYYDGTITVPESFSFQIKPNNDQQDALQHDYLPASVAEFFHVDERPTREANIFVPEKDMRIDEVATRVRISNKVPAKGFACTFDLYKLRDGATRPDDGKHLATLSRTFRNEGYHRVALDAPIYVKAGERLGIVVQQVHVADDGVTVYGIEAQECDGYRAIRRDPVYGEAVVNEGESFFIIEGITDKEEGSTDGWLDVTAPFSKEMLLFFKPEIAENPSMLDFYVDRYCGKPIQSFFNIDNFCIKAFGEPASLEHVDAVAPTCKKAGTVEHWLDSETGVAYADENGTEPLKDTTVAPLGHAWGKATYTWSSNGLACTAKRTCKRDATHKQTAKAEVTSKITKKPTATKAGVRTYTATFPVSWAKSQTRTKAIPATGMPSVSSQVHVQKEGWMPFVADGEVVGTTGKSQRLEALRIKLGNAKVTGGVEYRTHVQSLGWEKAWSRDGKTSGTAGKSKRLEAMQIRLYGKMAKTYDIYYRVHSQTYGWMAWAKNGAKAGTSGKSKRLEAVQVVLVEKGAKAPGKTYKGVTQTYAKPFV